MQIFSPDGKFGYICSSFNPETVVVDVATHRIVGHVKQDSPFCPNIAATPDGNQVWLTLKDTGRTMVFDAKPPFTVIKSFDTGPITNHVNFARTPKGTFAYVSVGGLNQIKVFRTGDFAQVATVAVGKLPHGVWPSGDGARIYVGLENDDALAVIDTATNTVIGNVPIGQAPQAIAYVAGAVPQGDGLQGLQQLGVAGQAAHLSLLPIQDGKVVNAANPPTSVALFDQGLTQVIQAATTGLVPKQPYVLALADEADGSGTLQPLAVFMTNPAGSAIVNAIGPIRTIVQGEGHEKRRYLVISPRVGGINSPAVQVQAP
jgi:YVTN family beta-propeller protein